MEKERERDTHSDLKWFIYPPMTIVEYFGKRKREKTSALISMRVWKMLKMNKPKTDQEKQTYFPCMYEFLERNSMVSIWINR